MISLTVNGSPHSLAADPETPLLWALRDELGLTGTKYGCGIGLCGICIVLIDGEPNHACMVTLAKAAGREVVTVEGLVDRNPGLLQAWIAEQVPQCGYCQPGQLIAAAALLARHPQPTDAEIDAAMSGVLCRCGTYVRIRRAIHRAARANAPPADLSASPLAPAAGGVALNAFIRIHADNSVTLTVNHTEMGQGALTALCMLVAEELAVPLAHMHTEFAPADPVYKNPLWGEQFTGGSSSVRGEWEPLRRLAAVTRERLVAAAAHRWLVAPEECRVDEGVVIHESSGRRADYASLAKDAARITPPTQVTLKTPEQFRLIGQSVPRLDIPDMVTGRTLYGIDVKRPGMLVASVVRCPVFGGQVSSFDPTAALNEPGVRQIVQIDSGVAVIAEDFWSALLGRRLLHVEWAIGATAVLTDTRIGAQLVEATKHEGKAARSVGRAKRILRSAARVVEALYTTPYLAHATLEPMNCIADVHADACDVWVGTQSQVDSHKVAVQYTDLPKKKVRIHSQITGGGFGRRLETDFVADAVQISELTGRPIQVIWTRADDLQHDYYRPAHVALLQAALDDGGMPIAWFMRIAGSELALEGIDMPYAVPHLREEHVEVASEIPTGAWRSVGASNNAFVIESFVDELAHAAGRDPFEFRRALLADAPRHRAVLELAADKAGWGQPLPDGRGRGIAVYRSFGSWVAQVAEVAIVQGQIQVVRVVCAVDCGIAVSPDGVRAQIEGGIAFGLSAALKEEIHIKGGRVVQSSFADYPILTLAEMPQVEVHIMESTEPPGGVGEPGVPVIAPAVANAVFAATGQRLRRLPLRLTPATE